MLFIVKKRLACNDPFCKSRSHFVILGVMSAKNERCATKCVAKFGDIRLLKVDRLSFATPAPAKLTPRLGYRQA